MLVRAAGVIGGAVVVGLGVGVVVAGLALAFFGANVAAVAIEMETTGTARQAYPDADEGFLIGLGGAGIAAGGGVLIPLGAALMRPRA